MLYSQVTGGAYKKICVKYQRSVKWEMAAFNINKSHILHVGSKNIKNSYEMLSVKMKSIHSVKDLYVTVASNL